MRGVVIAISARRVLRGRSTWLLIAVVGVAMAGTMAFVAGGRRAATSYDRLVTWSSPADITTGGYAGELTWDQALTRASALPQVARVARVRSFNATIMLPNGRELVPPDAFVGVIDLPDDGLPFERPKVLEGRLARARSEVMVPFGAADALELGIGDRLELRFQDVQLRPAGEEVVKVVGVVAGPSDFPTLAGRSQVFLVASDALAAAHPEAIDPTNDGLALQLRNGIGDLDAFRADVEQDVPGLDLPIDRGATGAGVRRLVRLEAYTLWIAAALLAVAGGLVVAQLLVRSASAGTPELRVLRALGLRSTELGWAGGVHGAAVGAAGGAAGTVGAVAASPLFPVGLARTADPSVGVHVDLVVVAAGTIAVTVLTATVAALAVLRAARTQPVRAGWRRDGPVARLLPVVGRTGVHFATVGRSRGHLLLGLAGVVAVTAAMAGIAVAVHSARGLQADSLRSGGGWDAAAFFDDPERTAPAQQVIADLVGVAGVVRGGWSDIEVNGLRTYRLAADPSATVAPSIIRGRAPVAADEIALGPTTMRALGTGVGEVVRVRVDEAPPTPTRVVGEVVLASPRFRELAPGEGALVPLVLLERWDVDARDREGLLVRFTPGTDLDEGLASVRGAVAPDFSFTRDGRGDVEALRQVERVPRFLIALLGLMLLAALAHRLIVLSRRDRRQLAVLRSLGFTGRQLQRTGAVAGTATALLALTVGVPLGVVAGTAGWRAVARSLVVVPVVDVPWLALLLLVTFGLMSGLILGAWTGGRDRLRAPAVVLRTE